MKDHIDFKGDKAMLARARREAVREAAAELIAEHKAEIARRAEQKVVSIYTRMAQEEVSKAGPKQ